MWFTCWCRLVPGEGEYPLLWLRVCLCVDPLPFIFRNTLTSTTWSSLRQVQRQTWTFRKHSSNLLPRYAKWRPSRSHPLYPATSLVCLYLVILQTYRVTAAAKVVVLANRMWVSIIIVIVCIHISVCLVNYRSTSSGTLHGMSNGFKQL